MFQYIAESENFPFLSFKLHSMAMKLCFIIILTTWCSWHQLLCVFKLPLPHLLPKTSQPAQLKTEWTLILQHLKLRETSWEAQWASPHPSSLEHLKRRSPLSTMKVWLGIRFAPNLCQSTPVPLTCAVSFDAPKRPKNRGGIGKRWLSWDPSGSFSTSSLRTFLSVNKVQTCMLS